jgi:hypothetical protein
VAVVLTDAPQVVEILSIGENVVRRQGATGSACEVVLVSEQAQRVLYGMGDG